MYQIDALGYYPEDTKDTIPRIALLLMSTILLQTEERLLKFLLLSDAKSVDSSGHHMDFTCFDFTVSL